MQKAADHLVDPFGKLSTVLSESEEAVREFDSVYQCNGYWKLILMSARRMRVPVCNQDSNSVVLFLAAARDEMLEAATNGVRSPRIMRTCKVIPRGAWSLPGRSE